MNADFDRFADIYSVWVESASEVTGPNRKFYVEEAVASDDPVVELGVGDGRIAIEVARRGRDVVGVDISPAMLELCRRRAEEAEVAARLTLIEADMREFELPRPARLITIPFHSIGHLPTIDDKRTALERIHGQLEPGGRLIFDHFVFDPDYARARDGVPELRAEFQDEESGRQAVLWAASRFDFATQQMRVVTWSDEVDAVGLVVQRRYRRLGFSWIEPEQVRALLAETGFEVEALYGDFERRPFDGDSRSQVWVARRPG